MDKKLQHFNESDQNKSLAAKHLHQFKLWQEARFSRSVKTVNAAISEKLLSHNVTYGYIEVGSRIRFLVDCLYQNKNIVLQFYITFLYFTRIFG